ncbi:pyrroline-5-carboxylate reductase [Moraxella macacae 0408225]|uniref:Pyrroline-5-carboxylate reductase n=1 Tax=Moraxella macacae 0408225 TaxID=1230338 RepID=L2F9Z4_9GAMM|nr:pyrroline-5-carboxylate reductase [Moraxella macacae]ELA09715.1 pyrroline-5-carboxylate reductase [Moraxella macacae 0408225]
MLDNVMLDDVAKLSHPLQPSQFYQKITFIGGGNMAQALITGLLAKGFHADLLTVIEPCAKKREYFANQGVASIDINDLSAVNTQISQSDVVILAIKPQVVVDALTPIRQAFSQQLVISILAGVSLQRLQELLGDNIRLARAMPNTPAMIQQGATGVFANVVEADKVIITAILSASGQVLWVKNEDLLHAVTAVSGSAPAYFFYVFEHMIRTGEKLGLSYEQAKQLTIQTALGSAVMALQGDDEPNVLRQKVTSPNGTTHAAICVFDKQQLGETLDKAMQACVVRSVELGKGLV